MSGSAPQGGVLAVAAQVTRRPIHLRRFTCEGTVRSDGLFEVVGTLIDTKPYELKMLEKVVPPLSPVHHLTITLTIDANRWIVDVQAEFLASPHAVCSAITPAYRRLIGMQIRPGFVSEAKRMFRGEYGCSHMSEMLPQMATTAYQMLWKGADDVTDTHNAAHTNTPLGGCHALAVTGEVVRLHFPQRFKSVQP